MSIQVCSFLVFQVNEERHYILFVSLLSPKTLKMTQAGLRVRACGASVFAVSALI